MTQSDGFLLGDLAVELSVELIGDPRIQITHIAAVDRAGPSSITFVTSQKYLAALSAVNPSAVVIPTGLKDQTSVSRLLSDDPYLSYAKLTRLWAEQLMPNGSGSVHASASVSSRATVAATAVVGPNVVIEDDVVIGDSVNIAAGCFVGTGSVIDDRSTVHPNVTIMHGVRIGRDCEIHSGAVIGADGFGWAPEASGWQKIYQLGGVVIGNKVSIGACTTVDRGALTDTVIADGVILDNQIQVAHNVVIGENTAIAGCTGIAGSTTIGRNCRIGGAVSIVGHINICDDVLVTADSFVNSSIKHAGSYSSGYPLEDSKTWRKNAVRLHKLDQLTRNVNKKLT